MRWFDGELIFVKDLLEKIYKMQDDVSFFEYVFYADVFSDIKAILILYLNKCNIQMNVLLRRIIEYTLYSVCLDIISRFGSYKINLFEYYWYPAELKEELWSKYKLYKPDLEKRLNRLYELNRVDNESKSAFRRRFFRDGNEVDFFFSLLLKPICRECARKNNLDIHVEIDNNVPNSNPEEEHEPTFKLYKDEPLCEYCKKNRAVGFLIQCPTFETVRSILKYTLSDESLNPLDKLDGLYSILSKYYVHFVEHSFDLEFILDNRKVDFNSLEGVAYTLKQLSFILCDYLVLLKNRYGIDYKDVDRCEVRKSKFSKFF